MLIDQILDRRDGCRYSAKELYYYCMESINPHCQAVSAALDSNDDEAVKRALISYLLYGLYPLDIINFVLSVKWTDK